MVIYNDKGNEMFIWVQSSMLKLGRQGAAQECVSAHFFAAQVLPLNERAFAFPWAKFLKGVLAAGHLRAMEHQ